MERLQRSCLRNVSRDQGNILRPILRKLQWSLPVHWLLVDVQYLYIRGVEACIPSAPVFEKTKHSYDAIVHTRRTWASIHSI